MPLTQLQFGLGNLDPGKTTVDQFGFYYRILRRACRAESHIDDGLVGGFAPQGQIVVCNLSPTSLAALSRAQDSSVGLTL